MSAETYRFQVGAFECIAVSDGNHTYAPPVFPPPASFLFPNAPREQLAQVLREHNIQPEQWTAFTSPYICLLVNTGEYRVLLDTGADGLAPDTGRLVQNLQSEGIAPKDIDLVILTHGHPDHIGGNTLGEGQPAFPNARYAMWKDEWDFWTSGEAEAKLSAHKEILLTTARKNLPPIRDRIDLVEREGEILPGIQAIAAPGHTPGHMAVAVSSAGEQLVVLADAVAHPIHVERPSWYFAVDLMPEQALASRRRLLEWAAAEKSLVQAFHLPFPGLGHVVAKGEGWQWQPVVVDETKEN